MAPHSSTLAWRIPWTEEPGGLQSMGSIESDTTKRLHFHFSLSCIGEGNGNPLQCSCLENPTDRKPCGLPSLGSHRVGHDWSDLAPAASLILWLKSKSIMISLHLTYHLGHSLAMCLTNSCWYMENDTYFQRRCQPLKQRCFVAVVSNKTMLQHKL